jgi:aspartate carbamoyltransferase catalytic subunit
MKHLLKLADLDKGDILDILNLADQLKYENQHGIEHHHLKGKTLGMIFQKSSTRTRVSFETGMYQLGGQALFLSNRDLQIGRGEPAEFDIDKVDVALKSTAGTVTVCRNGAGVDFSEEEAAKVLAEDEIYILVDLNQGDEEATAWGCDLTYDYVKINGDYRT